MYKTLIVCNYAVAGNMLGGTMYQQGNIIFCKNLRKFANIFLYRERIFNNSKYIAMIE